MERNLDNRNKLLRVPMIALQDAMGIKHMSVKHFSMALVHICVLLGVLGPVLVSLALKLHAASIVLLDATEIEEETKM